MLTTAAVTTLTALLAACRDDWDKSGVHSHVARLASDPRPWPELIVQAVTQAGDLHHRTPACILEPVVSEAVVRQLPPRNDPQTGLGTAWCDTHLCNTTVRVDGEKACCWVDRREAELASRPRPHVERVSHGPPAAVREQVEAMRRQAALRAKENR